MYQGMFAFMFITTMINMIQLYNFFCSGITTNLKNKKLSTMEVED